MQSSQMTHSVMMLKMATYHRFHADKEIRPVQNGTDETFVGAEPSAVPVVCLSDRVTDGTLPVQIHP